MEMTKEDGRRARQVAIVSGSARGLGAELVRHLAVEGT
jgi:NAD(P)-dependent dehydrogenase (short-subunit alcohol dehydrogenase family)